MTSTTSSVTTRDGVRLQARRWGPTGTPWATVLIVHGLSEHSGRYERLGGWLAAAGLDVHAYDQRGWGGSEGRRGDLRRWDDLLVDLAERLAGLRAASGRPLVLYGHSLGGLVSASYVLSGRPLPDLAVLSAPGIASTHSRGLRLLAAVMGRLAPTFRPPPQHHPHLLSRDPAIGEAFRVDPLAVHNPTARFGALGFAAQRRTRGLLDQAIAAGTPFPVPTLVIHGSEDGIVPAAATERFASFPNVTRRVYPGIRHEAHNEPEGEQIAGEVVAWLREQVTSLPVATEGTRLSA